MDEAHSSQPTDQEKLVRLHATIEGRVQGVGYRYFVQETASWLGVTGWVRNRWNGAVEVVAEGERMSLEKLSQALQRGPRAAFVSQYNFEWEPATGEFSSFRVHGTD